MPKEIQEVNPQIFDGWFSQDRYRPALEKFEAARVLHPELRRQRYEHLMYVSDLHGDPLLEVLPNLKRFAQEAPSHVFFLGDVVGTTDLNALQALFYNHVVNPAKVAFVKQTPDTQLLEAVVERPAHEEFTRFTLRDGFKRLRKFELNLAGMPPREIEEALSSLTDDEIISEVKRYAKYVHYGHYASNLPEAARERLAQGLEDNAKQLLETIGEFEKQGSEVHLIEGNWDARTPIDFEANENAVIPLLPEHRPFYAARFFKDNGVNFKTDISYVDTETSFHVLLPFDQIIQLSRVSGGEALGIIDIDRIEEAKRSGKTVVVLAHGEPNWRIHNLKDPKEPAQEHQQVVEGLSTALSLIAPDEIVHGHIHDVFIDEKGEPRKLNDRYLLRITNMGELELVETARQEDGTSIVVSFIPWKKVGDTLIEKGQTAKKIAGTAGRRGDEGRVPVQIR